MTQHAHKRRAGVRYDLRDTKPCWATWMYDYPDGLILDD